MSNWIAPQTNPPAQEHEMWKFEKREESRKVLAGTVGTVISDNFSASGLKVSREVWISTNGEEIAIRQKLWNRRADRLFLKALIPIHCEGKQSLLISNEQNT